MRKLLFIILLTFGYSQDNCCDVADAAECNLPMPGVYCPQCTDDCEWEPMQCDGATSTCWCVDSNGIEIEGSSVYPTWELGYPDCEQYDCDDYDYDGICDDDDLDDDNDGVLDEDDCDDNNENLSVLDECGVCGGDGTSCCSLGDVNCDGQINVVDIVVTVSLILDDEYNPQGDLNEDGVLNILDIVTMVNWILNGIPEPTIEDIDGNVYETVQIGEQVWMVENLKVTHYNNGDEIPYIYNDPQYGAYINYNNNADNVAVYGRLYNWFTVNDERGLCPDNWHVPSDDEFKLLEMYLGMSESEANGEGLRGTDEGGKLKEEDIEHWDTPNIGATNETGFTALPSGNRRYETYTNQEIFSSLNRYGFFWSSSEVYTVNAWYRVLSYDYSESNRYHLSKENAFSIRCVED